jgi:DNA-binding LacI/PurR family transcriptional regulator
MARKPTLAQVAAEAGVSIGTASNAFNRPDALSAALLERVKQAAEHLGYAGPDPSARRLRTGRAGAIGLIFTADLPFAFSDAASIEFLRGVADGVEEAAAGLLIVPGTFGAEDPSRVVREAAVDGFLMYSTPSGDPRAAAALARRLPTVTVDQPRDAPTAFIGIDDRAAAAAAARYIRDLGHHRVGIVTFGSTAFARGEPGDADAGDMVYDLTLERRAGYSDGLGDAHDPELVAISYPDHSDAADATAELLDADDPPTAILAMSDLLAAGAIDAAHARGLDVPGDLSVIGFDDSPLARQTDPPLTTIAQPQQRKGAEAARLLSRAIASGEPLDPERRILLPYELIERGTTAPPKKRG